MRRLSAVLTALSLVLCAWVPASAAASAADDLAALNAQRTQNGLPGPIAEDPSWSGMCAQHIGYMAATGTVTHGEDPAQPAFTDAGNWAGTHAVLSWNGDATASGWTSATTPFEFAPLHLAQLLAPPLATAGVADAGGYSCLTTWPGYTRAAPRVTRIVTYPGHGASIYAAETTNEWPFTPAAKLGLANPTGPHLYAFAWGRDLADAIPYVVSASVDGPTGAVPIRTVDARTPDVGTYLPTGAAIIIPVSPLAPDTTYTARIAFSDGSSHSWSFTALADAATATRDPATAREPITLRLSPGTSRRGTTRAYAVSITGQAGHPGELVRVRIGTATSTFRADAQRWFAGRLRVAVPRTARSARLVVRTPTGRLTSTRVPLAGT